MYSLSFGEAELRKIIQLVSGIGIVARRIAMQLVSGSPFDATCIERLQNDFWDYLEYHVYDQWEVEMQEFLMEVCIVEEFEQRLVMLK